MSACLSHPLPADSVRRPDRPVAVSAGRGRPAVRFDRDAALARRGDREAFGRLYERHRAFIFRVCLRMTGDPEWAQEHTSEAFVRALDRIRGFRGDSSFRTWLYRIAVRTVAARMRTLRRPSHGGLRVDSLDAWMARDRAGGPAHRDWQPGGRDHELDAIPARVTAHQLMRRLPESQRIVIAMRFLQDLPLSEIARLTGTGLNTVRSRIRLARHAMNRRYAAPCRAAPGLSRSSRMGVAPGAPTVPCAGSA